MSLGGRELRLMPRKSRAPLPVSTSEWMPSESIAELPVMTAATNLMTAIAALPMIAAMTAFLDSVCATGASVPRGSGRRHGRGAAAPRQPAPPSATLPARCCAPSPSTSGTPSSSTTADASASTGAASGCAAASSSAAGVRRPHDAAIADALSAGFAYFERVWRDEQRTPPASETTQATLASLGVRLPDDAFARTVEYFERLILDVPPEPVAGAVGALPTLAERYQLAVVCDTGYSPGSVLTELLAAQRDARAVLRTSSSRTSTA